MQEGRKREERRRGTSNACAEKSVRILQGGTKQRHKATLVFIATDKVVLGVRGGWAQPSRKTEKQGCRLMQKNVSGQGGGQREKNERDNIRLFRGISGGMIAVKIGLKEKSKN